MVYMTISKKCPHYNKIMTALTVMMVISLMLVSISGVSISAQIEDLKDSMLTSGQINSSLKDNDEKTMWLLSGNWKSNLFTNGQFNQTNPAKFSAKINMVMENGSSPHEHKLSHFTLANMSTENNSTVHEGYLSVGMKLGPVFAIPVVIRNFQNETISISLEPLEGITLDQMNVINHFENKPISGTFSK